MYYDSTSTDTPPQQGDELILSLPWEDRSASILWAVSSVEQGHALLECAGGCSAGGRHGLVISPPAGGARGGTWRVATIDEANALRSAGGHPDEPPPPSDAGGEEQDQEQEDVARRGWRSIPHLEISKKDLVLFYSAVDSTKIQHISEFFRMYPHAPELHDKLCAKYPDRSDVPLPNKAAQGDLFKVLEIDRQSSAMHLRAQFRRLSREFHPDKQAGASARDAAWAATNFQAVASAYEVLSDATRRGRWEQENADPNVPRRSDSEPTIHAGRLDRTKYDELIAGQPSGKWLLMFTMSQCSYCDELEAIWDDVARQVQYDGVKLAVVSCDTEPAICDIYRVQTVPHVSLILQAEDHVEVFRGALVSPMANVVPQIVPFVQRAVRLQSEIESIQGVAAFNNTVLGSPDFWVVYFGQFSGEQCRLCSGAYALLRHLSASMRAVGRVGKVDCSEHFHVCAYALNKGNVKGYTMTTNDLPKFMIYRSAPKEEQQAEGLSSPHVIKGWGESLLPRPFASDNEVYGAVTVMEKAVRLSNAHLVAEGGLRPFQDEEDRKFGDKQEAERKEPEAPQVPQEPPQPPPMMYSEPGDAGTPMMIGN